MASWSQRRRFIYATLIIIFLVGVIGVPGFFLFYKAPTCFDGRMNGSEQGTDCGGSCSKLCPTAFLPPAVSWTRFEQLAPRLYNVAAYIVNPNPKVEAIGTPYTVTLYDVKGVPIAEAKGRVTIPVGRNTLAFKGSVDTGLQTPVRAAFQFSGIPDWAYPTKQTVTLSVTDQKYTEGTSTSSLLVTLANTGTKTLTNITVYVILKDAGQNAIGFSRTIIDSVAPSVTALAPYTWPFNHGGRVVSIEVLPVAE